MPTDDGFAATALTIGPGDRGRRCEWPPAFAVLFDAGGAVGRSAQSLFVEPR